MIRNLSFLSAEAITFILAVGLAWVVFQYLPHARVEAPAEVHLSAGTYYANPALKPIESRLALERSLRNDELVVLGSSELTTPSWVALQKNYPTACGKRVLAMGAAGFQSLPMMLTLAEVRESLNHNSNITIILSPVWFTERGTPSGALLRFMKPYALVSLLRQPDLPEGLITSLEREARIHRDEFTGLYPDWLFTIAPSLARLSAHREPAISSVPVTADPAARNFKFDWDKEEVKAKEDLLKQSEGNPLGTTAAYFSHVKNDTLPLKAKPLDIFETEKKDLYALSDFLKSHGVHARFILQPIHRRLYKNLEPYDKMFVEISEHLRNDGHTWKSYFTEPYDMSILMDAAHFSDYAWLKVQREVCGNE